MSILKVEGPVPHPPVAIHEVQQHPPCPTPPELLLSLVAQLKRINLGGKIKK